MEIYEKKHYFEAVVHLVEYVVFMALGIEMIRVGSDALRHYPD